MATKTIVIDNLHSANRAGNPYRGEPNQIIKNTNFNYWSHPGLIVPDYAYGNTNATTSSGVDKRFLDFILVTGDTSYPYWGLSYTSDDHPVFSKYTSADTWSQQYKCTLSGGWTNTWRGFVEYGSSIIGYQGSTLYQVQTPWGSAVETTHSLSPSIVTDMIVANNVLYFSHNDPAVGYGRVGTFDYSTSTLITGAGRTDAYVGIDRGFYINSMSEVGDYIAITASKPADYTNISINSNINSRIYLWDGVSNTFDSKIDINESDTCSSYAIDNSLFVFSSGRGGSLRVHRYEPGASRAELVAVFENISTPGSTPYVRKQAITHDKDNLLFGLTSSSRGYIYGINRLTGKTIVKNSWAHAVSLPTDIYALKTLNSNFSVISLINDSSTKYLLRTDSTWNYIQELVTPIIYPSPNKRCRIKSVRIRYRDLGSGATIIVAYNPNQSADLYTGTFINLINKTGFGTSAGTGDAGTNEIRTYTFGHADGSIAPIIDSFQLSIYATSGGSEGENRMIILPIVIEVEELDVQ
jgi:hypothetical protein